MNFRIGYGYDVHRLVNGRKLMLGGVEIPHEKGCEGHSDADVLLHAICDALLGAAALRDIGFHFPNTSSDFKNIDSKILLEKTATLLKNAGWQIGNIDATVCMERPKINPHIPEMCEVIAKVLQTSMENISIKATTNEGLGYVGKEEGVTAHAVALIHK
ncbi:MAG TPA: 2-C-methyl-D-erythritol 2,4-cyclodiphosphate synthase [Bacteroidia bacterium]|nr:2-C-methyl-D-erythritol 2,4-cyclodiphosphate synthase [Bacteroidia bacterium]